MAALSAFAIIPLVAVGPASPASARPSMAPAGSPTLGPVGGAGPSRHGNVVLRPSTSVEDGQGEAGALNSRQGSHTLLETPHHGAQALVPLVARGARVNSHPEHVLFVETHIHIHRTIPPLLAAMEKAGWKAVSICDGREMGDEPSGLAEMIRLLASDNMIPKREPWETFVDPAFMPAAK